MKATLLSCLLLAPLLPAQRLCVTADTADCSGVRSPGSGGLARRAGTLAELRQQAPLLAIELGGTLSGTAEAVRSGGRLPAELLAHAGYDAVVLSSADLLLPDLEGLLRQPLPWIAANVYRDGKRLVAPFVVVGDVAIVGLADPPAAGVLPAGLEVRDPAAELAAVVATHPAAKILVATSLSAVAARALRADLVLCRLGGAGTGPALSLPGGVLAVGPTGANVVVLDAARPEAFSTGPVRQPLDEAAQATLQHFAAPSESAPPPSAAAVEGPLFERAGNRAAELQVHAVRLQAQFGPLQAPPGGTLVLVDCEWRNILPLSLVYEQLKSTAYAVPDMRDQVYLVADGCRLLRICPAADGTPGHLPVRNFMLPELGSTRRGWLAFTAATPPEHDLELRFYDFAHGHIFVRLTGEPDAAAAPIAPAQQNEVVDLGVFALARVDSWNGVDAPVGKRFVVVDVRATSRFVQEVEARAFDPHAARGKKMKLGTVADWQQSQRYTQLVVDGEYATGPLPDSPLGDAPRFLPDVFTGERMVFLAPSDAVSLALRCDFPNAQMSGMSKPIRPKGLVLPLVDGAPAAAARPVMEGVDDDVFRVELLGCEAVAGSGEEPLVVCTLAVNVKGERGEIFQTKEQLLLTLPDASMHPYDDDASARLRLAPMPLLFVPGGARRVFAVSFRAPALDRLRLGYRGLTRQHFFKLSLAANRAPLPRAEPRPEPQPEPRPEPPPEPKPVPQPEPKPVPQPEPKSVPLPEPKPVPPPEPKPEPTPPPPPEPRPAEPATPVAVLPPTPEPRGIAGVGLTAAQVNAAIDRGADGLWAHVQKVDLLPNNERYGRDTEHFLVSLALVHAGLHRRNPTFDAALRVQLSNLELAELGTYELGLCCMLIEHYGDATFRPKLQDAARLLFEGQGPGGAWDYRVTVAAERRLDPEAAQPLQVYGGTPLDGAATPWQRAASKSSDGDNSVSQFALLGLRAAAAAGVPLPDELWRRALACQLGRQSADGGWTYTLGSGSYGSMTSAGICALAICRHALGEPAGLDDPQVVRGLLWLNERFAVATHPEHSGWDYYYLYSLERVGRLLGTEFVGVHEWYPMGARYLVDQQLGDGTWKGQSDAELADPRLPSSFALLFLTRATEPLVAEAARGGNGKLRASVAMPPALRLYLVLDASGSMLERLGKDTRFDVARKAVNALLEALPDKSQIALRVYGHRRRSIEAGAEEDTALEVPWGALDRQALQKHLAGLRARGRTPLTLSLQQALEDLGSVDPARPITFVLFTDGGDDTRQRGELAAAASAITARGDVRFWVLGFAINRQDWTRQLQQAVAAGGTYLPVTDASQLDGSLRRAVFGTPDAFLIRDAAGKVRPGVFGETMELPEGRYQVTVVVAGQKLEREVWINTDGVTSVVFDASKLGR